MENNESKLLSTFLKIIDDEKNFTKSLDDLSHKNIFILQTQMWDYVMQLGISRNPNFTRDDIIRKIEPTASYMYKSGCTYEEEYCIAKICVLTNPNCASRKAKGVIMVLRRFIISLK